MQPPHQNRQTRDKHSQRVEGVEYPDTSYHDFNNTQRDKNKDIHPHEHPVLLPTRTTFEHGILFQRLKIFIHTICLHRSNIFPSIASDRETEHAGNHSPLHVISVQLPLAGDHPVDEMPGAS